jgi:hypothetical protein
MMGDAALQARAISSPLPRIAAHSRIVMLGAGRTVHPNRRKRILRDCTLQWETADASASILAASREPSSRFRRKIWRKDARRLSAWRKGLLRSCTSSAGQNGRPRGLSRCRSRKPTDPPALHASPGELRLPLTYSLVSVSPGGGGGGSSLAAQLDEEVAPLDVRSRAANGRDVRGATLSPVTSPTPSRSVLGRLHGWYRTLRLRSKARGSGRGLVLRRRVAAACQPGGPLEVRGQRR